MWRVAATCLFALGVLSATPAFAAEDTARTVAVGVINASTDAARTVVAVLERDVVHEPRLAVRKTGHCAQTLVPIADSRPQLRQEGVEFVLCLAFKPPEDGGEKWAAEFRIWDLANSKELLGRRLSFLPGASDAAGRRILSELGQAVIGQGGQFVLPQARVDRDGAMYRLMIRFGFSESSSQVALASRHPLVIVGFSPDFDHRAALYYLSFERDSPRFFRHELATGKRREIRETRLSGKLLEDIRLIVAEATEQYLDLSLEVSPTGAPIGDIQRDERVERLKAEVQRRRDGLDQRVASWTQQAADALLKTLELRDVSLPGNQGPIYAVAATSSGAFSALLRMQPDGEAARAIMTGAGPVAARIIYENAAGTLRPSRAEITVGPHRLSAEIVGERPDGPGLCLHRGQPEECRYFAGSRIDALHKQRIEALEQQTILTGQAQEIERLRREIAALKQAPPIPSQGGQGVGDVVADKLIDRATDLAVKKLLKKLF
jgi:hypothetical protein